MAEIDLSTIGAHGGGACMYIRKDVLARVGWKKGDRVAMRVAGEKLIVEKLDVSRLAVIRTGTPVPREEKV